MSESQVYRRALSANVSRGLGVATPHEDELFEAFAPYPPIASSKHLVVVRSHDSPYSPNPALYLEPEQVQDTVIGSMVRDMYITTPCEGNRSQLILPPLTEQELRPKKVFDNLGRRIGTLLQIPATHVLANQILLNKNSPTYPFDTIITKMVQESARLLVSIIEHGIIGVRETPGLMGHIRGEACLEPDEVGISSSFAQQFIRRARDEFDLPIKKVSDLDGYPTLAIRFPLANEWGVQESYLRIFPGRGRYIAVHPWNLGTRYLGDEDGDLGYILLRAAELIEKRNNVEMVHRKRVAPSPMMNPAFGDLTLRDTLKPSPFIRESLAEKWESTDLSTELSRLMAIRDADTRSHVASYTMAIGWWASRVLVASGKYSLIEAYRLCYNALSWFMENSMDARKGQASSALAGQGTFNKYNFMSTLRNGGALDFEGLTSIGVPKSTVSLLRTCWEISDENPRRYCEQSPIYDALVINRKTMERSVPRMLRALQQLGVSPADIYSTIIEDLTVAKGKVLSYPPNFE